MTEVIFGLAFSFAPLYLASTLKRCFIKKEGQTTARRRMKLPPSRKASSYAQATEDTVGGLKKAMVDMMARSPRFFSLTYLKN